MLRAADTGVNVGRLGRFGRLRGFAGLAARLDGCIGNGRIGHTDRARPHRYSRFRSHTRQNQPQMGGR